MTARVFTEQNLTGRQDMEQWLRCEASPGQFPGELAITGETSSGTVFSLFMPETRIVCSRTPVEGNPVPALLRVEVVDQQEKMRVVRLPRQTLENGQFVTVREDQLQREPDQPTTQV